MGWSWDASQAVIASLAALVGAPLGVITFYLRWQHESQSSRHAELVRRFEQVERLGMELSRTVSGFALDYTTKEEWLRECMYARGRIERLAEAVAGLSSRSCESAQATALTPTLSRGESENATLTAALSQGEREKMEIEHG
jgi:hypothetical protein